MNRIPPQIGQLPPMPIPELYHTVLSSGVSVHYRPTHAPDLVRLDIMTQAGAAFQTRKMVAHFSNLLLKEGCNGLSASQIAERFDYYGAYLYYSGGMEYMFITLCTPRKHFYETVSLLRDIYTQPSYPESETRLALEQRYQRWKIDKEKVQVVANTQMNELLFGANHPYGKQLSESDFEHFDSHLLHEFHDLYYRPSRTTLVLTGDIRPDTLDSLESAFGQGWNLHDSSSQLPLASYPPASPSSEKVVFLPRKDCLQSALRFSLPLPGIGHPDFIGLKVLNTVLGGYFGSRLMTSLREEKGYTYGIQSSHTIYRDSSYIDISTQTATQYTDLLRSGVYSEMQKLCDCPLAPEEMRLVRNYLSGEYARILDGPFSLSDLFISAESVGMPMSQYEHELQVMKQISPSDLQALARKYLVKGNMYEVCVG